MYNNKHYIRLDANSCIIIGFSDAFEQPTDTDICINQEGGRHFELSGKINPPLTNMEGQYLYTYDNGSIREMTEDERNTYCPIPDPQPSELELLKAENTSLKDRVVLMENAFNEVLLGGGV